MGNPEILQFLTHLAVDMRLAPASQNQARAAIIFLYKYILRKELRDLEYAKWSKPPKNLPVVLSIHEIRAIFQHLSGLHFLQAKLI